MMMMMMMIIIIIIIINVCHHLQTEWGRGLSQEYMYKYPA
jgi:hypothetical protein